MWSGSGNEREGALIDDRTRTMAVQVLLNWNHAGDRRPIAIAGRALLLLGLAFSLLVLSTPFVSIDPPAPADWRALLLQLIIGEIIGITAMIAGVKLMHWPTGSER